MNSTQALDIIKNQCKIHIRATYYLEEKNGRTK